jgi:hypothetical protein
VELGVLRHERLDEERRALRVEAGAQPVGEHLDRVAGHLRGVVVVGEGVPVRDEIEAVVRVLHLHPVVERPQVVAEVDLPRRTHPGQHAFLRLRHRSLALSQVFAERTNT